MIHWFAFLFLSLGAKADFSTCSHYISETPALSKAVEYLRSVAGTYRLGDCEIEFHVCEVDSNNNGPGTLVGDLLIKKANGQQRYLQIDLPNEKSPGFRTQIIENRIMLHYESDDRMSTEEFGSRESVRLEFLKSQDLKSIVSLEEGWFSTKDWRSRRRGSVYRWIQCSGSHPLEQKAP